MKTKTWNNFTLKLWDRLTIFPALLCFISSFTQPRLCDGARGFVAAVIPWTTLLCVEVGASLLHFTSHLLLLKNPTVESIELEPIGWFFFLSVFLVTSTLLFLPYRLCLYPPSKGNTQQNTHNKQVKLLVFEFQIPGLWHKTNWQAPGWTSWAWGDGLPEEKWILS